MEAKPIKVFLWLIGSILGMTTIFQFYKQTGTNPNGDILLTISSYIIGIILGALIFYIIATKLLVFFRKLLSDIERTIQKRTYHEIVFASIGLIIGLIIANLLSLSVLDIPIVGTLLSIFLNIVFGYLGVVVSLKKKDELGENFLNLKKGATKPSHSIHQPKILDTSVIIDGRIADICRTNFIEGTLIIPGFVLRELQHIADSSDSLKRNRGRRGLDILNIIQKELDIPVEILDKDFEDVLEVDAKLLKLAQYLNGKVITNDYNLNKVASFQGVPVLNINELANAVKPIVLPGEEMTVHVIKDGKENGQGIAYLDDGTMIVVDGGKRHMGESIDVIVTSILQTPAGRMIFAKPKYEIETAV